MTGPGFSQWAKCEAAWITVSRAPGTFRAVGCIRAALPPTSAEGYFLLLSALPVWLPYLAWWAVSAAVTKASATPT